MIDTIMRHHRHRWMDKPPVTFRDDKGRERRDRVCQHCGMTRSTIIPPQGFPWHEWTTADGQTLVGESTPPCVERSNAQREAEAK